MNKPVEPDRILTALSHSFLLASPDAQMTIVDASPAFLLETGALHDRLIDQPLIDHLPNDWIPLAGKNSLIHAITSLRQSKVRTVLTLQSPQTQSLLGTGETSLTELVLVPILASDGELDAVLVHRHTSTVLTRSELSSSSDVSTSFSESVTMPPDSATAAAAAGLGTFDYRLLEGIFHFNEASNAFFFRTSESLTMDADGFFQLLHPDDRERVRRIIDSAIVRKARFDAEFRVVTVDDRTRWLRTIGRASYGKDGKPLSCTGIMIDISREKRTEDALRESEEEAREARIAAEHASLVKDEFLSTLSHELRTPLNTILGWTQVLQRSSTRLSEKASIALATIERSARQQARLIDDLLDASAIIAGKIILDMQPTRCNDIIAASVAACAPVAAARNIKIDIIIDEPGIAIEADVLRLQQILSRLLSNAIKFSSDNSVITVRQFSSNDKVMITVTDTGQGIAPAFLPSLFSRFTQADGSITRTHMGLGLGLSIVKSLIELHGGRVSASSQGVSCGAVFTIELPALTSAEARITNVPIADASRETTEADTSEWPADIVVVDDEPDAGTVMKEILEQIGATVRLASSAMEALEMIRKSRPDLLISDIGMPQVDGYQLLRMLRSEEQAGQPPLPAIALTAFARPEDKRRAIEAGYLIHLAKPVESADLITAAKLAVRFPHRSIGMKPDQR